ncbi:uncharacterized protein LOC142338467 isoform X2 [Convolutriloba macropyga]|uniref:uncharacterized protein LOC142338467 isoform X2 n=1 Tax=Convolutriloba macropyga TaxID=536237 RepID=UPI003F521E1C
MFFRFSSKLRGSSVYALHFIQAGFLYSTFENLAYPLFGRYLNMPSHQYNSLRSLYSLAWGCKIFFSFFSDSLPILGYRRLPYLAMALGVISLILTIMALKPMPEPYYAVSNCTQSFEDVPNNPNAPNEALSYVVLFFLWYWALACSDSTIDALITQRSKLESDDNRGTLISYARISRQLGSMLAYLTVGVLLNTVKYGGTFCSFEVPFNKFMWIPLSFTLVGIMYACLFTNEKDVDKEKERVEVRRKLGEVWQLFHSWHYLKLLIFAVFSCSMWSIKSPALLKIQIHWAQVEPITSSFIHIASGAISSGGMLLYLKYFLSSNWRVILAIVSMLEVFAELPVVTVTIFGFIRDQYFWFVDDLFYSVTRFWFTYVMELIIVEYAPNGIEGITYALVWSICTVGESIGAAISNLVMSPFCLTDDNRYIRDFTRDQYAAWYSYIITVIIHLASLGAVFLVPSQKVQAQQWKNSSEKSSELSMSSLRAKMFVAFCIFGLVGSSALNVMTMFESTRCLMIAGGPGCSQGDQMAERSNCIMY